MVDLVLGVGIPRVLYHHQIVLLQVPGSVVLGDLEILLELVLDLVIELEPRVDLAVVDIHLGVPGDFHRRLIGLPLAGCFQLEKVQHCFVCCRFAYHEHDVAGDEGYPYGFGAVDDVGFIVVAL